MEMGILHRCIYICSQKNCEREKCSMKVTTEINNENMYGQVHTIHRRVFRTDWRRIGKAFIQQRTVSGDVIYTRRDKFVATLYIYSLNGLSRLRSHFAAGNDFGTRIKLSLEQSRRQAVGRKRPDTGPGVLNSPSVRCKISSNAYIS